MIPPSVCSLLFSLLISYSLSSFFFYSISLVFVFFPFCYYFIPFKGGKLLVDYFLARLFRLAFMCLLTYLTLSHQFFLPVSKCPYHPNPSTIFSTLSTQQTFIFHQSPSLTQALRMYEPLLSFFCATDRTSPFYTF